MLTNFSAFLEPLDWAILLSRNRKKTFFRLLLFGVWVINKEDFFTGRSWRLFLGRDPSLFSGDWQNLVEIFYHCETLNFDILKAIFFTVAFLGQKTKLLFPIFCCMQCLLHYISLCFYLFRLLPEVTKIIWHPPIFFRKFKNFSRQFQGNLYILVQGLFILRDSTNV